MRKPVLVILLFIAALAIGFIVGQNISPIERLKIVKEKVIDTVYQSQIVKVPYKEEIIIVDTVFVYSVDSVQFSETVEDTSVMIMESSSKEDEDTLQIVKDEKVKSETVDIKIIQPIETDSLLEKLLHVESVEQKQLLLEYWESPINFIGYKLSRTKLIIYGIDPNSDSYIYKNNSNYFLKVNDIYYNLVETVDFKGLNSIPKPEFIYD